MESPQLSSDTIFEILSRASLRTLTTCRLVSKECNRLTYEPSFLNLHSHRTETLSGFFFQTMKLHKTFAHFVSAEHPGRNSMFLDFLPSLVMVKASSLQGILVCIDTSTQNHRYYVCKPLTREWQQILNPKTRYVTESIAIKVVKSNPLEYKIVRFSRQKKRFVEENYRLRCEIFDSMVGYWRQIEEVKLPYADQLYSWNPPILASGNFHWMTLENKVFVLDNDVEKYRILSLPYFDHYDQVQLTYYKGKLAVICKEGNFFDLWVMENYQEKEWRKRVRISIESIEELEIAAYNNVNLAMVPGLYNLLWYKLKHGISTNKERSDRDYVLAKGVFPFRSDFEVCGLKNSILNKTSIRNKSKPRDIIQPFFSATSFIFVPLLVYFCLLWEKFLFVLNL
ncbi:F-box associated ubiquitination effector family protein [Euphorbia peplus]|nr:F-box associated ubiquitination effector family protein [Euphorbia peplus]